MLDGANSKPGSIQPLTTPTANACTNACTENMETDHDGGDSEIDEDFGEALKMIASLPLSKAEKAQAVRRLLAGNTKEST